VPVRVSENRESVEATVELGGDGVQRGLVELAQVATLGEVLAEQAVGVLVAAALPGAARVAEIDLDTGVDGELQMLGHLLAVIPGQRAAQLLGQLEDSSGQAGRMRWAVNPSGSGNNTT
jgi:hypothetical protein